MLNEWTDRMAPPLAADTWQRRVDDEVARRVAGIEDALREGVERDRALPAGFYDAMRHFLTMREKLFPGLPADPAWKILVTLAQTPADSVKASVTGIAHGADVPLTTALRYIAAMELEGVIERVPHPDDRRQVLIRLTREGQQRLDALAETWTMRLVAACAIPAAMLLYAHRAWAGF